MKAAVYRGKQTLSVEDVPTPEPGPGQVRVKMVASGICGSDLHQYRVTRERASQRKNCP